jgi:hypothetical protein
MPAGNEFHIRTQQKKMQNEKRIMNFAEISMRLFMELVDGLSRYEAPVWLLAELIPLLRCRLFILLVLPLIKTCFPLRNIEGSKRARLISRLACFLAATRDS